MPAAMEGVPEAERAVLRLAPLNESESGPDAASFAQRLNAPSLLGKRLLLLDTSALKTPDMLRSLFVSPKGWLCTLEHRELPARLLTVPGPCGEGRRRGGAGARPPNRARRARQRRRSRIYLKAVWKRWTWSPQRPNFVGSRAAGTVYVTRVQDQSVERPM